MIISHEFRQALSSLWAICVHNVLDAQIFRDGMVSVSSRKTNKSRADVGQPEHSEVSENRQWKSIDALQVQARDLLSSRLTVDWEVAA